MLELEIDGKALQVEDGSTVIEAAHAAGIYIPHFCYHKKLSIAANCRMCLVQVEKAPKPMPACATAVTNGMKVFTHSDLAVKAQRDVMEFLLINHPLDCPICDQGGECQLQDLSVGYGGGASRYQEQKRVVINKNLGPLVATDMTRCINCTRCVRFTQEVAGCMELGQAFRGDRAEIMPFVEKTVDSELSGNIIDLCPVGALTSKPFRFAARTWELSRRKSVSPHDSLGANLVVQTQHERVLRVLPLENEAVNECWLADKDRYSYEALNAPERLTQPMLKQDGEWRQVAWSDALDYASHALRDIAKNHGGDAIGALVSPHATLEEMHLAAQLLRGMGSDNIDFRLRRSDFSLDGHLQGAPWLGMPIAEVEQLDRVLLLGSFLRKDHPLLALRLRKAVRRGARVSVLHAAGDDLLMRTHGELIVAPEQMPQRLAAVLKAAAELKQASIDAALSSVTAAVEVDADAREVAQSLVSGRKAAILLGNFAAQHPQAGLLHALAQQLATLLDCRFGYTGEAANSVGGHIAAALPQQGGRNAARMLAEPRQAYVLLGVEPELDCADGAAALAALREAASVILISPFQSPAALAYADCLLPCAPFTETSGVFVNCEGRAQRFEAVARPQGECRPAWKILRVLGNLLELQGFEQQSSQEVSEALINGDGQVVAGLDNHLNDLAAIPAAAHATLADGVLQRVADVPVYNTDPLVRRADALQRTHDAAAPTARINAATLARLGLAPGERVRAAMGVASIELTVCADDGAPDDCVRIAAGSAATVALGPMFGALTLERI